MLHPGVSKTFEQYGEKLFVPYIQSFLNSVQRPGDKTDILKSTITEKRGIWVAANTKIHKNWTEVLQVDDNKTELFHFLVDVMTTVNNADKLIFVTCQ